jgi:tRNA-dihydrouridine synthase B
MNHEAQRMAGEAEAVLPPQHPVVIGGFRLANPFILAPMAGVSERPFRVIARELGASLAPTELISAAGLTRASARSKRFLARDPSERPFAVQLFGGDAVQMGEAAVAAREAGADLLDINMGCPVPKVTKNKAGSALLCNPELAAELVEVMTEKSGLPVTVKIRAGWDARSINAPEMARRLEGAGAAAVALHARTRAQGYSGKADWGLIARVKQAVQIPVIGNGDVRSAADCARLMRESGCDAVMIGRAALGYPWIFRELAGGEPPTPEERRVLVRRHFLEHLAFFVEGRPERPKDGRPPGSGVDAREIHALRQFRKHLLWYAHGLHGAAAFRSHAARLEDREEVLGAIDAFFGAAGSAAPHELSAEPEFDVRGALG